MNFAKTKAPGKLYIAGEYAVVEPGQPAVIVAVDRFITVSVTPSDKDYGTLSSPQLSKDILNWKRDDQHVYLEEENEKAAIVLKTMEVTEQFLRENDVSLPYYDIVITSTLNSEDGRKYGLGSSGAVTVAVVSSLLASAGLSLTDEEIFKLAAIVHVQLHSRGSLGDLAAAAYTGWLAYSSPDKTWLSRELKISDLKSLIKLTWPGLSIERLPEPKNLELIVGWTGQPASTESLVSVNQQNQTKISHQAFLDQSKDCVYTLMDGLKHNAVHKIIDAIHINRNLLLNMSQTKELTLETPLLQKLIEIAESFGASSKTSGAGGGDCGIALVDSTTQKKQILSEWQANKIEPLSLTVYDKFNS